MVERWKEIILSPDRTHHILDGKPLYEKRFISVMKFHELGIAPVFDEEGGYHIDISGRACYLERYSKTFGFYCNRAAVVDEEGWYHILPNGEKLYSHRYRWCGNYQENYCVVCDKDDYYFHIDSQGDPLCKDRYVYAGDFKDHIAVVQRRDGRSSHIYSDGSFVHDVWFLDLDVYHKNFARAKEEKGWCHIDIHGQPIYSMRFKMIEPFYNGYARVEDHYGALLIIDEEGKIVRKSKPAITTDLQMLSDDLVGFWKTQAIRAAVELDVFETLPLDEESLSNSVGVKQDLLIKLLRGLAEIGLVFKNHHDWCLTQKGMLLKKSHPFSLSDAALHWATEPYLTWIHLTESLKKGGPFYAERWGKPIFDWLDQDNNQLIRYQKAMSTYAKHDYRNIADKVDLTQCKVVADAGGGQGILLQNLLDRYSHLMGILLERKSVINQLRSSKPCFKLQEFDLFQSWPVKAEAIFLSRVLHDWNDEESTVILKEARKALELKGTVYIIERIVDKHVYDGGLLDLNMFVLAGGSERTKDQFEKLLKKASLLISSIVPLDYGNYLIKAEPYCEEKG